jgi:hypothetical protein
LLPGLQIATQNCGTKPFTDLAVKRKRIKAVDGDEGCNSRQVFGHFVHSAWLVTFSLELCLAPKNA